ncbi:hypothetical protein C5L14_16065 [Labrys okinawensis]|uniref:Uncharacterized protein n=1 Tax=Labrys okinawensis TaxID=346911 RepID=A0A2S9QBT5_9HYPH|nr:hypothetical protein [Labrys okinawensis]PRH86813.1 hypothetical protein C5L14_16065 [Labrys okinawensis]
MISFPFGRRRLAAVLLASLAAGFPAASALASGRLPPLPLPAQHFASFEACLEHLEAVQRADMAGVAEGAVADGENRTRQKLVDSEGIVRVGAQTARYRARVGNQFRVTDRQKGMIETTFSYEETALECQGGELTGNATSGYMLPGIEQLPAAAEHP